MTTGWLENKVQVDMVEWVCFLPMHDNFIHFFSIMVKNEIPKVDYQTHVVAVWFMEIIGPLWALLSSSTKCIFDSILVLNETRFKWITFYLAYKVHNDSWLLLVYTWLLIT
jgi:hypothetical protein